MLILIEIRGLLFRVRPAANRNNRGIFSRSIHRRAITDRSTVFARVTHFWLALRERSPFFFVRVIDFFEIGAPPFHVGTIRRLRTAGNFYIAIFGERQKGSLAGKQNRSRPVWR